MKKLIALLILLFPLTVLSQSGYYIKNYKIDVKLSTQGYFDVTETILVNFYETRRGIIRSIPYVYDYKPTDSLQAKRPINHSGQYKIHFENITVDKYDFVVLDEPPYKNIRIGNPDIYLDGLQTYVIKYRVWGAINLFTDCTEFNWNLIGTDWDCMIEKASWRITLPKTVNFKPDDVVVLAGTQGSKDKLCENSIAANTVFGFTTDTLWSGQGVSSFIRLPANYFTSVNTPLEKVAKYFYYNNYSARIHVLNDGSMDIVQNIDVSFIKPQDTFDIPFHSLIGTQKIRVDSFLFVNNQSPQTEYKSEYYSAQYYHAMKVAAPFEKKFSGRQQFTVKYKLWGHNFPYTDNKPYLLLDVLYANEPVGKASYEIIFDKNVVIDKKYLTAKQNFIPDSTIQFTVSGNKITGAQGEATSDASLEFLYEPPDNPFDYSKIPAIVFANEYLQKTFVSDINIRENGNIEFKNEFTLETFGASYGITYPLYKFEEGDGTYNSYSYFYPVLNLPDWTIFSTPYMPHYSDIYSPDYDFSTDLSGHDYTVYWNKWMSNMVDNKFTFSYKLFDVLTTVDDNYVFEYPVFALTKEPLENGKFTINLPDTQNDKIKSYEAYVLSNSGTVRTVMLLASGNKISGEVNNLKNGEVLMVRLVFAKDYLSISVFKQFAFLVRNNKAVFFFLIATILLFLLWYKFGKDKKLPVVVQYYPPSGITAAEAGYLWDNKLHKRDLIALIFEWAGKGYLSIEEIGTDENKDYSLKKITNLPADAKNFETTIFGGLFKNRESVKVSSLRDSFYTYFNEAFSQLIYHATKKQFFSAEAKKFTVAYAILAVITFVIAFFYLVSGHSLWFFSLFAVTLQLLFYSKIMMRFGTFGETKYNELMGFKEFIERAELPRLELLLNENPQYFEQTLAYATVLGLSNVWAEKFGTLITTPPSWYTGSGSTTYSTKLFTNNIITSMHKMERDMVYKKPPKRTYSSGSSSGSSYSYKSSSYSSSSSYKSSSGGGYKSSGSSSKVGGGYGGGGGKSW